MIEKSKALGVGRCRSRRGDGNIFRVGSRGLSGWHSAKSAKLSTLQVDVSALYRTRTLIIIWVIKGLLRGTLRLFQQCGKTLPIGKVSGALLLQQVSAPGMDASKTVGFAAWKRVLFISADCFSRDPDLVRQILRKVEDRRPDWNWAPFTARHSICVHVSGWRLRPCSKQFVHDIERISPIPGVVQRAPYQSPESVLIKRHEFADFSERH